MVDVFTGDVKWKHETISPNWAGCLTTSGGLAFSGDLESEFMAFDAESRKVSLGFPNWF